MPNKSKRKSGLSISTSKDILSKLSEHRAAIAELQKSAVLWGFTIEMIEKNFEKIGWQTVPSRIVIPSAESYLRIVRKRNELEVFSRNWPFVHQEMPQLTEWCQRNPTRLISHDNWADLDAHGLQILNQFRTYYPSPSSYPN